MVEMTYRNRDCCNNVTISSGWALFTGDDLEICNSDNRILLPIWFSRVGKGQRATRTECLATSWVVPPVSEPGGSGQGNRAPAKVLRLRLASPPRGREFERRNCAPVR